MGFPAERFQAFNIFTSGIHFPDVTVFRTDVLEKGYEGVRCAGFFGPDWGVETGEFAWRD